MEYYNETLKLLNERGSVRLFKDQAIDEKILQDVMNTSLQAASAGNLQPFSIIKISKQEDKDFLVNECDMQGFVKKAPVNFLFCIDFNRLEKWALLSKAPFAANHSHRHFWVIFQDTVICAQSMCTALDAYGLGSVYIGTTLDCNAKLINHFKLPKKVFPVVLLSTGYPNQEIKKMSKLRVEDVFHDDYYHEYDDQQIKTMYDLKYPHSDIAVNDRTLKQIVDVTREVNGDAYASEVEKRLRETQKVNYAQYRFGLHYVASEMIADCEEFKQLLVDQEIDWVK